MIRSAGYELTRAEFWARLDEDTRDFLRAIADPETGCGPLEFEGAWTTQEEEQQ